MTNEHTPLPHGIFDHCEHPLCDDWLGCCRCILEERNNAGKLAAALEYVLKGMNSPVPAFHESDPDGREYGMAMFELAKAEVSQALADWSGDKIEGAPESPDAPQSKGNASSNESP